MELDEAIRHAEEMAELNEAECFECAEEHRQLAEWLKELKEYKERAAVWLPDDELSFDPARPWWKCSHCYERTGIRTQFCPDCGYKMRCQEDG